MRHDNAYEVIYESPMIGHMERLLNAVNDRCEKIPWAVREIWSRQIIDAVSNIHSRGLIVGVLELGSFGVRADGSAVLTRLTASARQLGNEKGSRPPELRNTLRGLQSILFQQMTFRTDIFQLGLVLSCLAEHRGSSPIHFCVDIGCTSFPRYTCTEDHADPIELRSCSSGIPSYVSDIIAQCRSRDLRARPSAHKIAKAWPYTGEVQDHFPGINEFLAKYRPDTQSAFITCSECTAPAGSPHYRCNVCDFGNFDLCLSCVASGLHCFVPEHRLVKRTTRNGELVVDES
jgi:serine/threonine protein kinase